MSKTIQRFIERLRDWQNNFEVKVYEFEKYDCEISTLLRNGRNNNYTKECLETWRDIFNKKYFELKHPTYNHITTRAVANFLHPRFHINYIFFTDQEEKFTWLTLQLHGIADCFITEDAIYIEPFITRWGFHNAMLWRIPQLFSIANAQELARICYQEIPYQICFDNIRPAHFFGDDIFWFLKLQPKKDILKKRAFWLPKALQTSETFSKDFVYIAPRLYVNLNFYLISPRVIEDSLQDFNVLVHPQDKLDRFDKEEITMQDLKDLMATQEQREAL